MKDYKERLKESFEVAARLMQLPLVDLYNAIEHAESVGPILDPTLYRAAGRQMGLHHTIIEALLEAQRKIQPAREQLMEMFMEHLAREAEAAEKA